MNNDALMESLNPEQCKIVSAPPGNVLVLAGAGSGKTRVLTNRIAWLCHQHHFSPSRIMAVTFTNKAAREIRQRLDSLLGGSYRLGGMWLGTFHGLCHRLLRTHWQAASLQRTFQIIDTVDQRRLLDQQILHAMHLDKEVYSAKNVQIFINKQKERGWRAARAEQQHSNTTISEQLLRNMIAIYGAYEKLCQQQSLLDFPELILRSKEVLDENEEIRQHYQQHFQTILVDEFQDTNALQYEWLKRLAGEQTPVLAVGDDDQSIYGWRGARFKNIHDFAKDFPATKVYMLEQNYRSTAAILDLANALIQCNSGRLEKKLWTENPAGEAVTVTAFSSEKRESRFVSTQIEAWLQQGRQLSEVAVLYRSNAQSRLIEAALTERQIAYRVYGGLRFFERAVVKDALAYLRLALYGDDQSFGRVLNQPPRGLGTRSMAAIQQRAHDQACSLYDAGLALLDEQSLPSRAHNCLRAFYSVLDQIKQALHTMSLPQQLQLANQASGLLSHYEKTDKKYRQTNVENLNELLAFANEFENAQMDDDVSSTEAFLAYTALATDSQAEVDGDCVQIMTMHAAKGLEFPFVIMIGMREGLCPHIRSFEQATGLEEERRLCYVAITRAQEKLAMTVAPPSAHAYYSEVMARQSHKLSRFLREISGDLLTVQYEDENENILPFVDQQDA